MATYRIMVLLGPGPWSFASMHLVAAFARTAGGLVTLLQPVSVRHPMLLGSDESRVALDQASRRNAAEVAPIFGQYGVVAQPVLFEYASLLHGIVDAAEQLGADIAIVPAPLSHIRPLDALAWLSLERRLARRGCELYALEPDGHMVMTDGSLRLAHQRSA